MSKDIPYFRFTVSEWLAGDITLESDEVQGQFINACCYYWQNDCSIAKAKLELRLNGGSSSLNYLIEKGIIKYDQETDEVSISFLDEQWEMLSELRIKRQKAGKKGGKQKASKAKAGLKQSSGYKDKDKEKDNTCFSFSEFWDLYDKKSDKSKCIKKYEKISEIDRGKIKNSLSLYVEATPNVQYRKNPLTYLNGRCWEDEAIHQQKGRDDFD
jgi:hypothetical protein